MLKTFQKQSIPPTACKYSSFGSKTGSCCHTHHFKAQKTMSETQVIHQNSQKENSLSKISLFGARHFSNNGGQKEEIDASAQNTCWIASASDNWSVGTGARQSHPIKGIKRLSTCACVGYGATTYLTSDVGRIWDNKFLLTLRGSWVVVPLTVSRSRTSR